MTLVLAVAGLLPLPAAASAMCPLKGLTTVDAVDARCLFHLGTTAFRAKEFEAAAISWKALIALKAIPVELAYLKVDAYNNLGYLYFSGLGMSANRAAAIDYWQFATKSGNEESAYHLCHAYADRKETRYAPQLARGYCKEALRRYGLLKEHDPGFDTIVADIHSYLNQLDGH